MLAAGYEGAFDLESAAVSSSVTSSMRVHSSAAIDNQDIAGVK